MTQMENLSIVSLNKAVESCLGKEYLQNGNTKLSMKQLLDGSKNCDPGGDNCKLVLDKGVVDRTKSKCESESWLCPSPQSSFIQKPRKVLPTME